MIWTRDETGPRPMTDAEIEAYRAGVRSEGYELVLDGPLVEGANARLKEAGAPPLIQVSAVLVPLDGSPGMAAVMQPMDGDDGPEAGIGPAGAIVTP